MPARFSRQPTCPGHVAASGLAQLQQAAQGQTRGETRADQHQAGMAQALLEARRMRPAWRVGVSNPDPGGHGSFVRQRARRVRLRPQRRDQWLVSSNTSW